MNCKLLYVKFEPYQGKMDSYLLVSRSNLRPSEEGDLRGCCSAGEDEAAALDGEGPPPFVPSREKTLGLPPLGVPLLPLLQKG